MAVFLTLVAARFVTDYCGVYAIYVGVISCGEYWQKVLDGQPIPDGWLACNAAHPKRQLFDFNRQRFC